MKRRAVKLQSSIDARRALAKIANDVLSGEMEPRVAGAAVNAINALLNALKVHDLERKVNELEQAIEGD